MRAAQLVSIGRMEVVDVPLPEYGPGEVLVRVMAAGICGSDIHYFLHGGLGSHKAPLPMSLGHEAAGEVVEARADGLNPGDRVFIDPAHHCGGCSYCVGGRLNLCRNGTFMGSNVPGALREYVVIHGDQLHLMPPDMSMMTGLMMEPIAVAAHAVGLAGVGRDTRVGVFGAGPIGLAILTVARALGASQRVVIDPLEYRLKKAVQWCLADESWIEGRVNPADLALDVAFEAAGQQRALDGCFQAVVPGGKVVLVGIPIYDELSYNPHLARTKELNILNVRRASSTMGDAIGVWRASGFDPGLLVTHVFSLGDVQQAFETVAHYKYGVVKGMVTP